jgi:hypothetical protein
VLLTWTWAEPSPQQYLAVIDAWDDPDPSSLCSGGEMLIQYKQPQLSPDAMAALTALLTRLQSQGAIPNGTG